MRLDLKPRKWEDRIVLFVSFLIENKLKSSTVKSYLSAIRAVLWENNISLSENLFLLSALTRACKLKNDRITTRLPIMTDMIGKILHKCNNYFMKKGQPYLAKLYSALLSTTYYGLFRVGEVTKSPHVLLASNAQIATNKKKMLFILPTSKTSGLGDKPQRIKIESRRMDEDDKIGNEKQQSVKNFCPYLILKEYLAVRPDALNEDEQFFVFRDNSPVQPFHLRKILHKMLRLVGEDPKLFSGHSLRIGRASQLAKLGVSVETIKKLGRWKSNAVFKYLRD